MNETVKLEAPEFHPIAGETSWIDVGRARVGVYRLPSGKLVLIDSGWRQSEDFLKFLQDTTAGVAAILVTHMHIDHISNNIGLYRLFGCRIFATKASWDETMKRAPEHLDGHPMVEEYPEDGSVVLEGKRFGILPTPGHSAGHVAVTTPDDVCCVGDGLISPDLIRLMKLPYMLDAEEAVRSMEKIRASGHAWYLFAHKGVSRREEMDETIDRNIKKETDIYRDLLEQLTEPASVEQLTERFFAVRNIRPTEQTRPWLVETIGHRIRELERAGEAEERDGLLYRL